MPTVVGVPVKLLHESEGHKVSVELVNGEVYRGLMVDAEDNMNCQLQNVTLTGRDGKVSKLEHVYLRGSKVRFIVLPDMLKNAPMFNRFKEKGGKPGGLGVGRGTAIAAARGGRGGGRGGPRGGGRGGGRGGPSAMSDRS